MRWGLIKVSAGIAITVTAMAGCSDPQSGTALPVTTTGADNTDTSTGQTTPTTARSGAPEVKDPLDASKYVPQPCAILSADTLKELNIGRPGKPDTDSELAKTVGPSCTWNNDDQPLSKSYGFGLITGNPHGISDIYRTGKKSFPGYFEPTEVTGYPAVYADTADGRDSGNCNLVVGISSSVAFRVGIGASKDVGAKSCDLVKQLAATVIQTLKGA